MNIDFKFWVFDKIKFDLDEIMYSGAFEVADYESEFKIQKFNMANSKGRPKSKRFLRFTRAVLLLPPFTLVILLHTWVQPFPTDLHVVRVTVEQRQTTLI